MSLLERYIGITVLKGVGFSLFAFLSLVIFIELVDELTNTSDTYTISMAMTYVALKIPRLITEILATAVLIGTLVGLGQLARHSELISMRAAGVSLNVLAKAILKVGVVLALLSVILGEWVAPPAAQHAERLKAVAKSQRSALFGDNGFWLRDDNAYLNIREIGGPRRLDGLYVYEFDDQLVLRLTTHAEYAEFDGERWVMHNLALSKIDDDKVAVSKIERAAWGAVLDPSLLNVIVVGPDLLPVWQVFQYADFLRDSGQRANDVEYVFWTRLLAPINIIVLMIIALPFVFAGNPRGGAIGQRIFFGAVSGVGFYMLSKATGQVALLYELNPFLSAALPISLFALVAVIAMRKPA